MLSIGSRVTLLASSVVGKSIGPKRGSIGYVISPSEPGLKHIKGLPSFQVSHLSLMFSRFGLEKKARCEYRSVLNIFPSFNGEIDSLKGFEDRIQNFLSGLIDGNFSKHPFWKDFAMEITGNPNQIIVVTAPALNSKPVDMSTRPFGWSQAWIESLIRSEPFILTARTALTDKMIAKIKIPEKLTRWVIDAHSDKKAKLTLMEWAASNKEQRNEMVELLRRLHAVSNRRWIDNHLRFFTSRVSKGACVRLVSNVAVPKATNFTKLVSQYMFEPNVLERKEAVIGENKDRGVLMDTVMAMKRVRDLMLSLVPKN